MCAALLPPPSLPAFPNPLFSLACLPASQSGRHTRSSMARCKGTCPVMKLAVKYPFSRMMLASIHLSTPNAMTGCLHKRTGCVDRRVAPEAEPLSSHNYSYASLFLTLIIFFKDEEFGNSILRTIMWTRPHSHPVLVMGPLRCKPHGLNIKETLVLMLGCVIGC